MFAVSTIKAIMPRTTTHHSGYSTTCLGEEAKVSVFF
jgi:hypothetical protein